MKYVEALLYVLITLALIGGATHVWTNTNLMGLALIMMVGGVVILALAATFIYHAVMEDVEARAYWRDRELQR